MSIEAPRPELKISALGVAAPARSRAPNPFFAVIGFLRRFPGFTIIVVIPGLLITIYFGFIQSNIYTSTAQFLVRSATQNSPQSGFGAFLQNTGLTTNPNDAYTVNTYLTSRDALKALEANPGIRTIYARPEGDFISRFPNFYLSGSFENLFMHYNSWIKVEFDAASNITTLTVQAFRPGDAQALTNQLLILGESDVNQLNDRVRTNGLKAARKEVGQLQTQTADIQNQITAFRSRSLLLDPTQTSTQSVTLQSSLETDLVSARAALNQLQAAAPNSPQIPALRARIIALESQVGAEGNKGAGGQNSLAPKVAEYQQLVLKQQVVQQMLQSALTALQGAEATVQQQQLYLSRVAEPNLPDRAQSLYDRLMDIGIALVSLLLIYGIGRLLSAAAGDYVLK